MRELDGKVAVVTGAGSGIGAGIAEALAEAGADVVVADIELDRARDVAERLESHGGRTRAFGVDVTEEASVTALADRAWAELGGVHILCNNAGVLLGSPILDAPMADWQWAYAVNVLGVVHGIRAFVPRMIDQGGPAHVVNTASMASFTIDRNLGIYAATKHAVTALTETLRLELDDTEVRVVGLYPGGVATNILDAGRNRQDRFGGPTGAEQLATGAPPTEEEIEELIADILDPLDVGRMVRQAILDDRAWVLTHPHWFGRVQVRWDEITAAADASIAERRAGTGPPLPPGV